MDQESADLKGKDILDQSFPEHKAGAGLSVAQEDLKETKQNTGEHHMAQDLGTISKSVIPIHPIVPNPYTLFLQVPHEAK